MQAAAGCTAAAARCAVHRRRAPRAPPCRKVLSVGQKWRELEFLTVRFLISAEVAGHGSVYCENGNTRNTEKLFSKRKETVLQKLFVGRRRAWPPGPVPRESCRKAEMDRKRWHTKQARRTGREGGTPARAATRKLEQFSSTTVLETATATDCRYLDYNSNPAISAEVAAERGERNPHKAPETN